MNATKTNANDTAASTENTQALTEAVGMSGLLFQRHPTIENWKTTRPGAMVGEVAAWKHEESRAFISLKWWEAGDEDDGYVYQNDGYEVETYGEPSGMIVCEWFTDRADAIEHINSEMERINDEVTN